MSPSETGALLRSTDWSATPLGAMQSWPPSLRVAVDICQSSRFPMFVWWGPSLVNLYNDAYIPVLGKRHPVAFGKPAQPTWEEIWPVIGPQAEAVMTRGEATWNERVLLVMERNGYVEDTYFTWSYSPIRDETGRISGLFCACTEETAIVTAERERDRLLAQVESERTRLAEAFRQSPAFLAVLRGPSHVFESINDRYSELVGRRDVLGKPVEAALPELRDQGFVHVLHRVYATGEPFVGTAMRVELRQPDGTLEERFLDFLYQPVRGGGGDVAGILVHGVDVTETRAAEQAVRESETRFRNMSDNAPVMIWVTGPGGNCEYVNRQWMLFTGQTQEDATGLGWLDPVHPDDTARSKDTFLAANRDQRPFAFEYRLRRADGQYRWCVDMASPRRSTEGEFLGYVGSVTDITDRKRVEDAQAIEKEVLELIATGQPLHDVLETIVRGIEGQSADAMLCSILLLDETGEHLQHGAAPSLPEAYNRAIHNLRIGPAVGSCGTAAFTRRPAFVTDIATSPPWEPWKPLAERHALAACCSTPIFAGDGRVLGTVAMYYRRPHEPSEHDTSLIRTATRLAAVVIEKHQVDRRLRLSLEAEQDARSEAERANRIKDEFLATLSHELRTPLNAILGWSQVMALNPAITPELAQGVAVVERNARAQGKIIADLLDMSAIMSGKVRLDVQRIDLVEIVQLAIETARPAAVAKSLRIETMLEPLVGVTMQGDPNRLQQVLWNLISNAIKFTPEGGRVRVCLERTDGHVEVSVGDTGEGIAPEFVPFVFDRFRQADASTTRRFGGLGLGLSIVKQLVELHGGAVRVDSEGIGRGATFTVRLPIGSLRPRSKPAIASRSAPMPESPDTFVDPQTIEGLRVLVVDDDEDARDLVRRLLEERHADVTTAASAEEALRLVRQRKFDILVSDIGMPGEDGHALIRRVRMYESSAGGNLPAVALTAYARPEDRLNALRAGFQMHIQKPVEPAELIVTIASLATMNRRNAAG